MLTATWYNVGMNFKCLECGEEYPEGSKFYHLRTKHGLSKKQYRIKHGIKIVMDPSRGFQPGMVPHNKKYESDTIEVSCSVCGAKFLIETRWYHYRLRKGKDRFSCPSGVKGQRSVCCKKLQSLTIKEVRSTLESRAKTTEQITERWKNPAIRKSFATAMKAKGPEWHSRRMAATLKSNLSGKMTKPEKIVQEQLGDSWKYVGNGDLMVGGLNPDFKMCGTDILLEVFGCYWHGCNKCFPGTKSKGIPLNQRLATFEKHGYKTIIVWSHELSDPDWKDNLKRRISETYELITHP